MPAYNPYTYQPMMQSYFMGRPMPAEVSQAAQSNPEAAKHIVSVWQFMTWLNQSFPQLYNALAPRVKEPATVVTSGAISPTPTASGSKPKNLSGLGQADPLENAVSNANTIYSAESAGGSSGILSDWGRTISDIAGKYLVIDQQRKLIDLNIKRAEQGLPPIDSTNYGAAVAVGLSPQTQQLAYLALGGLVVVGLLGALRSRK